MKTLTLEKLHNTVAIILLVIGLMLIVKQPAIDVPNPTIFVKLFWVGIMLFYGGYLIFRDMLTGKFWVAKIPMFFYFAVIAGLMYEPLVTYISARASLYML